MKIEDTTIQTAGVNRCCIASFAEEEDSQKEVVLNERAKCKYCHTFFTLVVNPFKNNVPIWMPDWQLTDLTNP